MILIVLFFNVKLFSHYIYFFALYCKFNADSSHVFWFLAFLVRLFAAFLQHFQRMSTLDLIRTILNKKINFIYFSESFQFNESLASV